MDYEIDIEEHDLLDNPVIKTMFPDISVIKKEITEYFEEEPIIKEEPESMEIIQQTLLKPENLGIENSQNILVKPDYHTIIENETLQNSLQRNKIILGSKPKPSEGSEQNNQKKLILGSKPELFTKNKKDIHSVHIKHVQDDNSIQILNSKTKGNTQDENKIKFVLGSKPFTATNNEIKRLDSEQTVKLKEMKLVLQDIKSYLNQNGRYCKPCCRLFPSKTTLDVHRNKMHNANLVCKNVKEISNGSQYRCCVCGVYVANKSNLLRHYRNIHNKNVRLRKSNKGTSEKTKSQKSSLIHPKHNVSDMKATLSNRNKIKNKTKLSALQCKSCFRNFATSGSLTRHLKNIHNIKREINIKNEQSALQCKSCCISFSTNGRLMRHLNNVHKTNANNIKLKKIQKIEQNFLSKENDKEKQQITLPLKQNVKTATDEQINKFISYVEIHKDITIREDPKEKIVKSAVEYENIKKTTAAEKYLTKETHKVKKDNDLKTVQAENILYNSSEVPSGDEVVTSKSHTKKNEPPKDANICLHCNKEFADQKLLIEHMYEVLEPKGNSSRSIQTAVTKKENKMLFVCRQCSYYLSSVEAYFAHLSRNHKTETFMEVNKEVFDAKCKYCPYKASNITTHNRHVHSYHIDLMYSRMENEIENDEKNSNRSANNHENSFALESVLFECNKCCICFLSSDMAKDHNRHKDSVTNWKCSLCNHIFKEQYKELHLQQHSFSQPLKVYNLNETAICNVLYNCTKCAIHFTEKRYKEHFPNCGSVTTDSAYCNTCVILIDKMEINYHKIQHDQLKDIFEFTIIDSNIIMDSITTFKRKGMNFKPEVKPKKKLYEQYNSLTYCSTCKSYLTYSGLKNESHIKKNCFRLHTYPCDECGLVFTSSTLEKHKERHENEKNLKIQDFKFFDLQGIQIRPPIPEYLHCKICKIHFLRKKCISTHICEETDYLTCDICNIKLSENTYKLHMTFHFYVMYNTVFKNDSKSSTNQVLNTDVNRKLEILEKPVKSEACFESKTTTKYDSKEKIESKKIKPAEKLQNKMKILTLEQQSVDILPNTSKKVIEKENPAENIIDLVDETDVGQISKEGSLFVMYTCKRCGITVESYDEVIKHCQTHYSGEKPNLTSVECNKSSLKFDSRSSLDHVKKGHTEVSKIQVLKFDPCYLTSKNIVWMKHIFQNITEEIVKELLKTSIYQQEHRIRMECIQKGSLPLYVYKCDSCGNCVDPGNVYIHAKSPCGRVRKQLCSLCGLPFVSIVSRNNHEKLHKQVKNLTKKSLNIVLFNQSKDKTLNERIFSSTNQYVLYQCRNCDRVAEKTILSDHVCNRDTLNKCIDCHLLLSIEDFEAHSFKHKYLKNYCSENFKVILFGRKNDNSENGNVLKTILPSFSGTVYDYTLYKCEICKMCIKNHENMEKHTCMQNCEQDSSICSKCELIIRSGNMRYHMKQHNTDPHFIRENMNVISFNNRLQQQIISLPILNSKKASITLIKEKQTEMNKCKKEINIVDAQKKFANDVKKPNDDNKNFDYNNAMENEHTDIEIDGRQYVHNKLGIEKVAKEDSYDCKKNYGTVKENENNYSVREKHVDNSKEIDIVKNSNEKIHVMSVNNDHKDKAIETVMDNNVHEDVEILYKCKCGLHFLDKPKAKEHNKKCHPKELKQNCSKCHLLFNSSELFSHLLIHHKDKTKVHNFKVIESEDN